MLLKLFPPPNGQVKASEPINGTTLQGLLREGMIDATGHRDEYGNIRGDAVVRLRMSRPLLRILINFNQNRCDAGLVNELIGYRGQLGIDGSALPVSIDNLLSTCRDYHGDTQEEVQLVSLLVTRAAYLLITPENRPLLNSLADMRPGAVVVGDPGPLEEMVKAVTDDATALDKATETEGKKWREAVMEAKEAEWAEPRSQALTRARGQVSGASAAYVEARFKALALVNLMLVKRGQPSFGLEVPRQGALIKAGSTGLDAWLWLLTQLCTPCKPKAR